MNIEKTIEYLENVMSSEVRLLTLQEEIKSMQALLDDKNDYYDYFINGQYEKIFIPPWIPYKIYDFDGWDERKDEVFFGPHFRGKYLSELSIERDYHTKRFTLEGGEKDDDLTRMRLFSNFVLNSKYFEKASDIHNRMCKAIRETSSRNDIGAVWLSSNSPCYPPKLARDCFYICIVYRLKDFLGITDPFNSSTNDNGFFRDEIKFPPGREDCGCKEETDFWGRLIKSQKKELLKDQIIKLDRDLYTFFKGIPEKVKNPSPEMFKRSFSDFFRMNKIKVCDQITEGGKIWGKDKTSSSVYEMYSDQDIELLSNTLYPFYCELLSAANDYFIDCYNLLFEKSTPYAVNKDFARRKLPELERMLQEEKETLEKLYGLDVIFGKYRGIVPVGSFIDYFASGRCDSFEGPNGAYNTYELELRLDKITNKLDVIIEKLDEIKANQRAMYFALSEMNRILRAIHGAVNSAAKDITNTLKAEGDATRRSLESVSSILRDISSHTAGIRAEQEYSSRLQEISNERLDSIISNQRFEQLLYTDPTIFGSRRISDKAFGKYH